jgi:ribulose-5-phosphate 4-epimerase/fuculose-1-phosphate aldolase
MTELAPTPPPADGVTHFGLHFLRAAPPAAWQVEELAAWRDRLCELGLVGQQAGRYDGVGFGNLSVRHPHRPGAFIITGTQTGARAHLAAHDFAIVTRVDIGANSVHAHGGTAPSSEAMTHAQCYAADPRVGAVFHGHSPLLWHHAAVLGIPATPADIGYGTPGMALAIAALLASHPPHADATVLKMGGHEDGIIAIAATADAAGQALLRALALAGQPPGGSLHARNGP